MDFTTLIGIASGVGLVLVAIFMGGGISIFINIPSMMITFGGTLGATLINFPFSKVMGVLRVVKNAFFYREISPDEVIKQLVDFATIARREGVLALEQRISSLNDPFLQKGLQLAVDGTPPETIREILRTDIDYLASRHKVGQEIFNAMGTYAPAFGMIGTLIGLIQMLRTLDDPSKIGQGMATALLTTFYGALFANLICLPIAGKLKVRSEEEILSRELIVEGILSIQSGDNPRIVEEKLKAFIAPRLREKIKVERR
ncbi:flagellar motor protein [Candidatus Aerophobetes bacterium]|uniref:Flagellar motor protein n=1 Tax=Aerophobetes bacterium TaxID=2030807 RepID=A0A497E675_UNCAE|nr:MAG: flagellar motor protein [Candidatus Aerophobetes bacterium]